MLLTHKKAVAVIVPIAQVEENLDTLDDMRVSMKDLMTVLPGVDPRASIDVE